jgi:hypothetical protein
MFSFKEWYIKGTKFGSVKALEKIFETVKTLFKFDGTATTDADGTRYLVNKGSGDDVILKTGANYKTGIDTSLVFTRGYGNGSFIHRRFIDAETPTDNNRYIGRRSHTTNLRIGVTTNDEWSVYYTTKDAEDIKVEHTITVPRNGRTDAVITVIYSTDSISDRNVYTFINGVLVDSRATITGFPWASGHDYMLIGYLSSGARRPDYTLDAVIGNSYMISSLPDPITQAEAEAIALFDYQNPEKALFVDGDKVHSEIPYLTNTRMDVSTVVWYPLMGFSGSTVYKLGHNSAAELEVSGATGSEWQPICSNKDYQRALTSLSVYGQVLGQADTTYLNISAQSFEELPTSIYNIAKFDFGQIGQDVSLVLDTINLPVVVDWSLSNKYYFNPSLGSNYTGLGTPSRPFGILDASIIKEILSNHDYALGVPEFTLQSGTYPMLELFEAGLDFSKGYQLSDAPDDLAKITTDVNNVTPVFSYGFELTGVQNLTIDGNSGLIIHQSEVGSYLTKNPNNDGRIVLGANYAAPDEASQNKNINFKNFSFLPIGEHDGSYPVSGWTSSADFLHRGDGGSKLKVAKCNPADTINFRGFARSCVIDNVTFWGGSTTVTTQSDVVAPAIVNSEIAYFHEDALKVGNPNTLVANVYIRDSLHINPLAHSDAIQSSYADNTGSILTNNKIIHTVDKPIGFVGEPQPLHGIYDIDGQKVLYNTYQDYINAGSPLYGYNYVDSEGFVRLYSTEEGVAHEGTDAYSMYVVTSSLQGIFLSTESLNDNVTVANNLVIPGNQAHGITGAYVNSTIVNNTVLGKIGADYYSTHDNCIVANNIQTSIGAEANSVGATYANNAPTSSVTFVDSDPTDGTYDFSLVSNITGDATYAPVTDINGVTRANPPSVGAYEYQ